MAAYRFWRITVSTWAGNAVRFSEVKLLDKVGSNIAPVMTGATSPAPYVVSHSTAYSGSFEGWQAFNRIASDGSRWHAAIGQYSPQWVQIDMEIVVDLYGVSIARDSDTSSYPVDMQVLGSATGAFLGEQVTVASYTGLSGWPTDFSFRDFVWQAFEPPPEPTTRAFINLLGRQNNEVPNALLPRPSVYDRAAVLGRKNIYYSGSGRVAGTVKYKPNSPVHRKVRLLDEKTGVLVREMWSNPITGAYSFDYVDETRKYTVLSYDYTGAYRAVIADNLVPELIP